MPFALTSTGLTLATYDELYANLVSQLQTVYGTDIVVTPDSPDGQAIGIFIQTVLDIGDLILAVYNQFDPDNAFGVVLDQRVAINGIQRQDGTFTVTPITITNNASINLYGLDQTAQAVYTVADNAGNQWQLQTTQLGLAAGAHALNFQAATPGAQLTIPNTITVAVTVVLGVTAINNPTTYTTLGVNEEADSALKIRRVKSVSLASQGYLAALLAALENITGVSTAFVYENTSGVTDSNGVPGHSIWVIVGGSGTAADIANAIYTKRNAGCGMFGAQSLTITQVDGTLFTVFWDNVTTQEFFVAFTATSIDGVSPPQIANIRSGLPTLFAPGVNEEININEAATHVQEIDPNTLVTAVGLTLAFIQTLTLSGVAASGTFQVSYNGNTSAAINFNDPIATIQTKVQAVTGLGAATVTGSIASQSLVFNLTNIGGVLALVVVTTNSLQTSAPAAITFAYNEGYTNTLTPSTKKNQLLLASANIIILPMIMNPSAATLARGGATTTFAGLGGYGTITYSFVTNNSGGTINASSGLYTSGASGPVTDTVKASDKMGNSVTALITVT